MTHVRKAPCKVAPNTAKYYSDPDLVMDPRNLGAMQPNRLSASRSFLAKMIGEAWHIERDVFALDAQGNGRARYTVRTPGGPVTFLAFLKQPSGKNRTGRIIGTAWDMSGALIDGVATPADVEATERELPRLYEGRATANTLVWFRSNQSLRIFRSVRQALARGAQPDIKELKRVGYIMRNTGLDGNGTFGTMPFAAIPQGHPLGTSYHAQMLSAYLMRELSVDLVEELARIDAPDTAVRLEPSVKRLIGVGNGSALGLAMLVYNRPVLVNAYISAYLKVLDHVLTDPAVATTENLARLEELLDRTIRYRTFLTTSYRFFTSNMEIVGDLRRIRAEVRAARRGEVSVAAGESVLGAVHRMAAPRVSKEALHSFDTLLLELVPDFCDQVAASDLVFTEELGLDPRLRVAELRTIIERQYGWALDLPLNDEPFRDRVWYQSRAAEEPRSGPREEVPVAHELIPSYPVMIRTLLTAIDEAEPDAGTHTVGELVATRPELEHIARLVVGLQDKPYAVPHADPHDTDFIPVWVIRFVNAFIHGLDRTEDHMGRDVRGIIFESAPYRDAIAAADASAWWWSYEAPAVTPRVPHPVSEPIAEPAGGGAMAGAATLTPTDTPITPPSAHATTTIDMKFREARLMAGRAFQALNVPEGSWHGAREFVITAMAADPAAATAYGDLLIAAIDSDTALAGPWHTPSRRVEDGVLVIDNHGQSLLATGHVLVNLLGAHATDAPTTFHIVGARADHALAGVALELQRYGILLDAEQQQDVAGDTIHGTIALAAQPQNLRDDYLATVRDFKRNGRTVDAETFWNIFYRGNAGLDADTPISRQHTGGTVLDVIRPGERITKQFSAEELHLLTDPDELDNQHFAALVAAH